MTILHGIDGVPSLRGYMETGADPTLAFADDELVEFAQMAILDAPHVADPEHYAARIREQVSPWECEALFFAWKAEMAADKEVRAWFVSLLPPDLAGPLGVQSDLSRCPFRLEPADGPFKCAGCGNVAVGRYGTVVDRCGWLGPDVSPGELSWCLACLVAVIDA